MAFLSAWMADLHGQTVAEADTVSLYGERKDSLDASVAVSRQDGNYIKKGSPIRTEVISSAGLQKMACCTLAESFENSASVTVGYSDAVTGARQIRLLGLSGVYTQMLDENRPAMRGLASPFGLSYVPGQWLSSIQIAKGASSVINGVESMTGQINMEFRKPTDEKPLFLNASVMSDTKLDFNAASSLQIGDRWSTVLLGHVSGNLKSFDHNHDGYMDDPRMLQFNFANRWYYLDDSGVQLRFGVRALQDSRKGGQEGYDHREYSISNSLPWGSDIMNRSLNGYVKVGVPLSSDNSMNIAVVADYTLYDMDSWFGSTMYSGRQHSGFLNVLYRYDINSSHSLTAGFGSSYDRIGEDFRREIVFPDPALTSVSNKGTTDLFNAGIFAEYTFHAGDRLTAIAGARGEWYNLDGFKLSPRATLKYSPAEQIVIRLNGGRGLRYSMPFSDNIGVLSTGKAFKGIYDEHLLEDSWTYGGNVTYYLPFVASSDTYISFDYFHTLFSRQMVVDYEAEPNVIYFYALDGRRSYTDTYQLDFSVEPVQRFKVTATFRYTDAMIELRELGLVEKPMTSKYKGVLNLQYATRLDKWIFDFTASVNGPARVYSFMEALAGPDGKPLYRNGYTPAFPMLYAQVTRRFKGVDIYIGGENLTGFRQKDVILGVPDAASGVVNARQPSFDASAVWGPLMGARFYAGVRFTLWKGM